MKKSMTKRSLALSSLLTTGLLLCGGSLSVAMKASAKESIKPQVTSSATASANNVKHRAGETSNGDDSPHYAIFYPDAPSNGGRYVIEGQGMPGDKLLVRLATEREDQTGSTLLSTDPCRNSEPVGNDHVIEVDAKGQFTCEIVSRDEDDAYNVIHNIKFGVLDPASLKGSDVKSYPNELVTVDYKVKKYPAPAGSFTVDSPTSGNIAVPAKIRGRGYPGADIVVVTSSITSPYCVAHVSQDGRWECPDQLDVDYTQGNDPTQLTAASYLNGYENSEFQQPEEVIDREFNLPPLRFNFTNPAVASDINQVTPVQLDNLPDAFVVQGTTSFRADDTPVEVGVYRLKDGQDPSGADNWTWLYDCYAAASNGGWGCDRTKYPFNLREHGSGYYAFSAVYSEYAATQIVTYMRLFEAPKIGVPQNREIISTDEMAIAGAGEAGDSISVVARGSGGEIPMCKDVAVNAEKQWECEASTPSNDGPYSLVATQTLKGKAEGQKTITFVVKHDKDDDDTDPEDPWDPQCTSDCPPDNGHSHNHGGGCPSCAPPPPPPGPPPPPPGGGGGGNKNGRCPVGAKLVNGKCHTPKDNTCPAGYQKVGNNCEGPDAPDSCPSGYTYDAIKKMCFGPIPGGPAFLIILPPNQMPLECGEVCQTAVAGTIPAGDSAMVAVYEAGPETATSWKLVSGPYSSQVDGGDSTHWKVPTAALKRNSKLNIIAVRMHNGQMVPGVQATQMTQIITPVFSVESPSEGQTLTVALGNVITLAGQAMPGSKARITGDVACDAPVDSAGHWACQAKVAVPVKKSYWISAADIDASTGQAISEPVERNFYVHKYELTVDSPEEKQAFDTEDSVVFSGQATPGSNVTVTGAMSCNAKSDAAARWSCGPFSLAGFAFGDQVVTVSDPDDAPITRTFSVLRLSVNHLSTKCTDTASYSATCHVKFKVMSPEGKGVPHEQVTFKEGKYLYAEMMRPYSVETDTDGNASVEVYLWNVNRLGYPAPYDSITACVHDGCSKEVIVNWNDYGQPR